MFKAWFIVILFVFMGCGSSAIDPDYLHPTSTELRQGEICAEVFSPQYAGTLGSSRGAKISSIKAIPEGVLARFSNGNAYVLSLPTGLPMGTEFYCGQRYKHYPCISSSDWDPKCTRPRSIRRDRFNY